MQSFETDVQALPAAGDPRGSEGEISLLELSLVLAKRRKFILAATIICAVLEAILSMLLPKSYTATTVILPPQTSSAGSALLSQLSTFGPMSALAGGLGTKGANDTHIAMLRSRTVEDAMVRRFDLKTEYHVETMSDALKAFAGHCEILSSKDGLISISVIDRDPNRASVLANAYVDEYRKFSQTLAITEASQRRLFFEQQLTQAKDKLASAEEALKTTQQVTGMLQLDSQARALLDTAASLRGQIAAKEVEIHAMRSFASDGNPDLQLAEQQLSGWRAQLSRLTGSSPTAQDDLMISKGQVPGLGLEYIRRTRDVKYYETIFELLAKQFEMAKLDEAREGSMIQVVDLAIPPDRRSSPKRTGMVIEAALFGFVCALLWTLTTATLGNIRKNPDDKRRLDELSTMLFHKKPLDYKE